jgi:hypothetical protein
MSHADVLAALSVRVVEVDCAGNALAVTVAGSFAERPDGKVAMTLPSPLKLHSRTVALEVRTAAGNLLDSIQVAGKIASP